jgi:CheY-like chemotaxis protein
MIAIKPIKVLIVEDNQGDVELAKEYFKDTGIDVTIEVIHDGQQAIDFFDPQTAHQTEKPDLVLMDLNLPKRNGHEVLDFIRKYDGKTKVIIYSGSRSPTDAKLVELKKADAFLIKPIGMEEMDRFVARLREILRTFETK